MLCLLEGEKRQTKLEETLLLFVDFIFAGQGLYQGIMHAQHMPTTKQHPHLPMLHDLCLSCPYQLSIYTVQ